jgi:amino acid permease
MFGHWRATASVANSDDIGETSVHSDSSDVVIDLKGDKLRDEAVLENVNLSYLDLWALALTTSIGGHYLAWSTGLSAGFGTFMIATVLMATGFICLLSCLSELASAIPFAGKIIFFSINQII